ncbi:MAG: tetratricopeptide repeat protein [Bacteroidia bacterium]|nr:tetratricopeptide repeat protein [Bacteroidia bacterium]
MSTGKKNNPKQKQNNKTTSVSTKAGGLFNRPPFWLAVILLLTYISFAPSLKNGFTNWDDNVYVAENNLITSLSSENIKEIFKTENHVSFNYHPITILSLAIDYNISEYAPRTFHLTNILLHLLNTALVFIFIYLLSGNKLQVAVIVALFFGIHPMHVESVTWISERKDVLYTFFFMSALIIYYKYIHETGKNKVLLYILILFLFILAILSKAMAVVLPAVLLLVDYYSGRKFDKYTLLEKLPLFTLSFLFGLLTTQIQQGAIAKFETFTVLQRFTFASYGFINYISNLFVPINLSCFYPYPTLIGDRLPIIFYVSPFIVLALFALVFFSTRFTKAIVFGFLFFCATIALVLQFISVGQVIMADRYSYVPYIGLLFPIALGYDWLQHNQEKRFILYKKMAMILLPACVIACMWLTNERTKVWMNGDTLWTDALTKYPCGETFLNRGSYLVNKAAYDKGISNVGENEYDRALNDFNIALQMNPGSVKAYTNRANIYGLKNQFDLALSDYSKALQLDSTDTKTFFNRGITYSLMKQFDKAIADYTKVLQKQPDLNSAKQNRAYAYIENGNYEKGIRDLSELIALNPVADYYFYRGLAYNRTGENEKALADYTTYIQSNPNNPNAYFNRSVINKAMGKYRDALADAIKAESMGYKVESSYMNELKIKVN